MSIKFKRFFSFIILFFFIFNFLIDFGFISNYNSNVYATEPALSVNINFQTEGTKTPEGYIPDIGGVFSYKNGYSYGWNNSNEDNVYKRNVNSDILLDTISQLKPDGIWEIALPNGEYDVNLSVGDAVYATNLIDNSIKIENIIFFSNTNLQSNEFKNVTQRVSVTDGRLSLYQDGISKSNIPLNYIQIASVYQNPTPPAENPNQKILLEMFNQNTELSEQRINPRFRLTNVSNEPINLKNVKIRYYYFVGGETPQDFWCDYSSIGTGVISGHFVKLPEPMMGADHYVEITFDENVGTLGKNKDIDIKTRFSRSDNVYFDQSDDYSFNSLSKNKFVEWTKATVYLNDQLVWGEEPSQPLPITTTAKVQMYNKHRNESWDSIHTYFKLFNTGNVQLKLSDIVIRYYYTKEGTQSENFICDSSSIGEDKITKNFVSLPQTFSGSKASNYIDIGFTEDSGYIIAGDNLEIQSRIKKSDDSNYTQTNDYSFNPTENHYIDWSKASVYIKGKLVWGKDLITDIPKMVANQATESTISLSWDNINAATSYEVEADGVFKNVGNSTVYIDYNLQPGTLHTYRVRAVNDINHSDWSEAVSKWTLPGITQNIKAMSTSSSIIVSWDSIIGVTSYEIEVAGMPIDVGMNASYIQEGLNPNTQRAYRVRGKNSSGVGKWSETISKSTLPGSAFGISTSATSNTITVAWDKSAGATSYDLEVDGVIISDLVECLYTHENLLPSTEHSYRVRPKNQDGTGNWTEMVKVYTLPTTPSGLKTLVSENSITISWEASQGADSYEIEIDGIIKDIGNALSYKYEGLDTNSEHSFRVRAKFNEIRSLWSNFVSTSTLPSIPTNLSALNIGGEIQIKWDFVEGALFYDIDINGTIISNVNKNSYTLKDITPNTKYIFKVRSIGNAGASEWSNSVESTSLIGIPQGVTLTAANDSISLQWLAVEGATGYEVLADGNLKSVSTDTYYINRGLQPNTLHVYRIRALSGSTAGEWTEPLLKTTIQGVPGNLRGKLINNNILVMWDSVSGATSYEINADGNVIDTKGDTSYFHLGLATNNKYTYSVRSKRDGEVSPWSEEITIETAPEIPENLKATATTNTINLSWDTVTGATSYDVEVDGRIHIDVVNVSQFLHDGLESNTKHSYRVRSRNESAVSEWSIMLKKNTDPELMINAGKDSMFNFVFVIPMKFDAFSRTITVEYNPDELEVVDLCAVTPALDTKIGVIEGTSISVDSFTPGKIKYTISDTTKTQVNSIKFMAKVSGFTKVVYEVE